MNSEEYFNLDSKGLSEIISWFAIVKMKIYTMTNSNPSTRRHIIMQWFILVMHYATEIHMLIYLFPGSTLKNSSMFDPFSFNQMSIWSFSSIGSAKIVVIQRSWFRSSERESTFPFFVFILFEKKIRWNKAFRNKIHIKPCWCTWKMM